MKISMVVAVLMLSAIPAFSQSTVELNGKYPLQAKVLSIQPERHHLVGSWDVIRIEINGATYRTVFENRLHDRTWLPPGDYAARRVKHGIQLEFIEDNKKHHETLQTIGEEATGK